MLYTGSVIPYGKDPLQTIKALNWDNKNEKVLVVIHGGAWRDPNNTFDDFGDWASYIRDAAIPINLLGINYRLSPEFKHPIHLWDCAVALESVCNVLYSREVILCGHSVGATICLQLLNFRETISIGLQHIRKENSASSHLVAMNESRILEVESVLQKLCIKEIIFVDGIYSISGLIEEYGVDYENFVNMAFVSKASYIDATQLTSARMNISKSFACTSSSNEIKGVAKAPVRLNIYQSLQDELLSKNQTLLLAEYLDENSIPYKLRFGKWGEHEKVYSNIGLLKQILEDSRF